MWPLCTVQVPLPQDAPAVGDPGNFCSESVPKVIMQLDCAGRCAGEDTTDPRAVNCPAFYYNSISHQCILLHYFDATLALGAKDGWAKYSLKV